jgi:hypothetical protein
MLAHTKSTPGESASSAFGDDVPDNLRLRQQPAVGIDGDVAEGVEADLRVAVGADFNWPSYTDDRVPSFGQYVSRMSKKTPRTVI